ncbi:non-ribosomal peptide synthetase [Chitinophaga flava]|uniref:Carrier domain-containing protein n=1 Tax=Chitinophaga flava TaxID=2259036 RepID=A0A365XWP8_9BACT|nr:non-ribosomal peptide synthetase [Chitinophaga flava]RBL90508.1 hypothetical protein DF182_29060 [Chitinophaga flava]
MMTLLKKIREHNLLLEIVEGKLEVFTDGQAPDPLLLAEIRERKSELVEFLLANDQANFDTSFKINIPVIPVAESYPLSPSQRRMWVLSQFRESSIGYNMSGAYVFEGAFNDAALTAAFHALIARHEILRTVFREDEHGVVRQFILPAERVGFAVASHDLRTAIDPGAAAAALGHEAFIQPFDFVSGPLLRAGLYQVADNKWIFTYVMHHIISDGWSMGILFREVLGLYDSFIKGNASPLPPLRIQYRDYASWQQEQLSGALLESHKRYWLGQFDGDVPVLELPSDKVRPAVKTYNGGAVVRRSINATGMRVLLQPSGATLFMGLLALVKALFYRYTQQGDITIGTPVAGREHADLEDQIGFYVNTLALRTRFSGDDSYRMLLHRVRDVALGAYEHQVYPFDELVDELKVQRDMSRNPLFDVQVIADNAESPRGEEPSGGKDWQARNYEGVVNRGSVFDLVFHFTETATSLETEVVYNTDVFSERNIIQYLDHLENLLEAVQLAPDTPISQLAYLGEEEQHQLNGFNNTGRPFAADATLVSLFEQQVALTPDATAVVYGNTKLSYKELDERSGLLASYLRRRGYGMADHLIGIMLDRSANLVISILGVLKSGAAYVPIDPSYPRSRKSYILEDAGIGLLLTETSCLFDLDYYNGEIFATDVQLSTLERELDEAKPVIHPEQLAYVIYTSGSTGTPKGVMIEHGAITNSVLGQQVMLQVNEGDRNLQFCSPSFDVSVFEIFITLSAGAALYIINEDDKRDAARLERFITQEKIDMVTLPAAYLGMLDMSRVHTLKQLVAGGEVPRVDIVTAFSQYGNFYNAYGPTESAVCVSLFKVGRGAADIADPLPLGRPLANVELYITDDNNKLLPIGVVGEICIGGAGLARGYLNNPDLTAEKFVQHPFKPGQKLYRTGDLGKWAPEGNIVFTGRKDNQVKIRGYRIELEEIELALRQHPGIDEAVVTATPDKKGEMSLYAYITGKSSFNISEIRAWLSTMLPGYMIPHRYMVVPSFPLTPNGKIDKTQLPGPGEMDMSTGVEYVAPRNETEKKMVAIWQEILGKEKIGVRDGFFDLGGDSIRILRMTTAIRNELDLHISTTDIYKNTTIESILAHIAVNSGEIELRKSRIKEHEALTDAALKELKERVLSEGRLPDPSNIEDIYLMSDIEKGMVYESLLDEQQRIYHDQMVQRIIAPATGFNADRFQLALELMADKHSILRTAFNLSDYETELQIVYKKISIPFQYRDLSGMARQEQELLVKDFMSQELERPFDFSAAPLWRINLFDFGNHEIIFIFQTHHAIMDGWSDASFTTELYNLYTRLEEDAAFRPAKLKSGYRDYIIRQEIDKQDDLIKKFWKNELAGYTRLDLFTREEVLDQYRRTMDRQQLIQLEKTAAMLNTTVKVVSLSAYLYLLKTLNYHDDIVAGLVTNARPDREDGDRILGCFLNTIPLRFAIDGYETCIDLIAGVHNKLVSLKEYERLSMFEISRLHMEEANRGNPFFDTIFNYVDFHAYSAIAKNDTPADTLPLLNISSHGRRNTWFDISIDATGGGYDVNITLVRKLRSGITAEKAGWLYLRILEAFTADVKQVTGKINLLDEAEKNSIHAVFNNTGKPYPQHETLVSLFEKQVAESPERHAVVFEGAALTYAALNEEAGKLADYLRNAFGTGKGSLVGIMLGRSEKLIVAILAVLKTGAAYVPVDPGYPEARKEFMLKDAGIQVLITHSAYPTGDLSFKGAVFLADVPLPDHGTARVSAVAVLPDDLAYVIYTSGSTGQPKGVMVEHAAIVNTVFSQREIFGVKEGEHALQFSSPSFDASVWEIFMALAAGAALYIVDEDTKQNPRLFEQYLTSHNISIATLPPSYVRLLQPAEIPVLQHLITAGEEAPGDKAAAFSAQGVYYNAYGPTETAICATVFKVEKGEHFNTLNVPVGRPVSNTQVYILNSQGNPVPPGAAGEICIAGAGLARGYLNNPALTAERFVPDPFKNGPRMYRTGDTGRWLPDGNIEFTGRKDAQVKINGFRIETGEVETALSRHPNIEAAAVSVFAETGSEAELVAYIVGPQLQSIDGIRDFLAAQLPAFMLPAQYIQLDQLPLTPNGKLDKKALPRPALIRKKTDVAYVAPGNETERRLVGIWQEILRIENIGIKDNFFESGGHSLKAMKLVAQVHKEFDVKLRLAGMFREPTIENIAKEIARQQWVAESRSEKDNEFVSDNEIIL